MTLVSPPISACVVCRNEADRLEACLQSLSWLDDVVVMNLASDDDSAAVARRSGARVIDHSPVDIVEMVRNVVADAAAHDWVLVIDPDERVSPGLALELAAAAQDHAIDAVVVPRMNCDFGVEPTHSSQRYEPQLRMYRRSVVTWPHFPNQLPKVPSQRVRTLAAIDDNVLIHDRSRTIAEVLERSVRYAPAQAQAMLDAGQTFTASGMVRSLGKETRTKLVEGQAWRDGVPGLIRTGVLIGFKFYVWAEFWRRSERSTDARGDRRIVQAVAVAAETTRWTMRCTGALTARARRIMSIRPRR